MKTKKQRFVKFNSLFLKMQQLPLDLLPLVTPTKEIEELQAVFKLVDTTLYAFEDFALNGVHRYSGWFDCFLADTGRKHEKLAQRLIEEKSKEFQIFLEARGLL